MNWLLIFWLVNHGTIVYQTVPFQTSALCAVALDKLTDHNSDVYGSCVQVSN